MISFLSGRPGPGFTPRAATPPPANETLAQIYARLKKRFTPSDDYLRGKNMDDVYSIRSDAAKQLHAAKEEANVAYIAEHGNAKFQEEREALTPKQRGALPLMQPPLAQDILAPKINPTKKASFVKIAA